MLKAVEDSDPSDPANLLSLSLFRGDFRSGYTAAILRFVRKKARIRTTTAATCTAHGSNEEHKTSHNRGIFWLQSHMILIVSLTFWGTLYSNSSPDDSLWLWRTTSAMLLVLIVQHLMHGKGPVNRTPHRSGKPVRVVLMLLCCATLASDELWLPVSVLNQYAPTGLGLFCHDN